MKENKKKVVKKPAKTETAKKAVKVQKKVASPKKEKVVKPVVVKKDKPTVNDKDVRIKSMEKDIESYKMTVGQLEELVDQLRIKNQKAKKQIASLQEKLSKTKVKEEPAAAPICGVNAVPVKAPISPFCEISTVENAPAVETVDAAPFRPAVFVPQASTDNFLKGAVSVRY